MSDNKKKGLYGKFIVQRTDGSHCQGGKHHGCNYYVLDLDHDEHALPAMVAYEKSCREKYPELAKDLRSQIDAIRKSNSFKDAMHKTHWQGER